MVGEIVECWISRSRFCPLPRLSAWSLVPILKWVFTHRALTRLRFRYGMPSWADYYFSFGWYFVAPLREERTGFSTFLFVFRPTWNCAGCRVRRKPFPAAIARKTFSYVFLQTTDKHMSRRRDWQGQKRSTIDVHAAQGSMRNHRPVRPFTHRPPCLRESSAPQRTPRSQTHSRKAVHSRLFNWRNRIVDSKMTTLRAGARSRRNDRMADTVFKAAAGAPYRRTSVVGREFASTRCESCHSWPRRSEWQKNNPYLPHKRRHLSVSYGRNAALFFDNRMAGYPPLGVLEPAVVDGVDNRGIWGDEGSCPWERFPETTSQVAIARPWSRVWELFVAPTDLFVRACLDSVIQREKVGERALPY